MAGLQAAMRLSALQPSSSCSMLCSAAARSPAAFTRCRQAFVVQQQALQRRQAHLASAAAAEDAAAALPPPVKPEAEVPEMTAFLDGLKWDSNGLVVAIAQHADTGEVLMQAFADRAAVNETLQTGWVGRLRCWVAWLSLCGLTWFCTLYRHHQVD